MGSTTVTSTITPAPVALQKRQTNTSAVGIISECVSGENLSLITAASIACSCLFIPQTTTTLTTTTTSVIPPKRCFVSSWLTLQQTRTESGTDFHFVTASSLVTSGTDTVTFTVTATITPSVSGTGYLPSANTTGVYPPGYSGPGEGSRGGGSVPTSTLPIGSSSAAVPPVSGTASSPLAGTNSTLAPPTLGTASSALFSSGSATIILSPISSTVSSVPTSLATSPWITAPISGTGSLPFANSTGVYPPGYTGPDNGSRGGGTLPTSTSSAGSGSITPIVSANTTVSAGPTNPFVGSASGFPSNSINGSLYPQPLPTGNAAPDGCPIDNGSYYVTEGQTYQLLCDARFLGPSDQGFYVANFYECIHDCAIVNLGFSQSDCYAATYYPNNGVGSDCFFMNSSNSQYWVFNPKATSALLINNTVNYNLTYNASLTASIPPRMSPTALPITNTTSPPFVSSVSA